MSVWDHLDPTGVISRLLSASQAIEAELESVVTQESGLTLAQLQVLRYLAENSGAQPSQLSEALGCTRGNITGIVNRLHRDGLVTRQPSENDRRVIHLDLTPAGAEAVGQQQEVEALCRSLVAHISADEQQDLQALLDSIAARARSVSPDSAAVGAETQTAATVQAETYKTQRESRADTARVEEPRAELKGEAPEAESCASKEQDVVVVNRSPGKVVRVASSPKADSDEEREEAG